MNKLARLDNTFINSNFGRRATKFKMSTISCTLTFLAAAECGETDVAIMTHDHSHRTRWVTALCIKSSQRIITQDEFESFIFSNQAWRFWCFSSEQTNLTNQMTAYGNNCTHSSNQALVLNMQWHGNHKINTVLPQTHSWTLIRLTWLSEMISLPPHVWFQLC